MHGLVERPFSSREGRVRHLITTRPFSLREGRVRHLITTRYIFPTRGWGLGMIRYRRSEARLELTRQADLTYLALVSFPDQIFCTHPAASLKKGSRPPSLIMLGPNYNVYWHVVVLIRLLGEVNYAYTVSQSAFLFYAARYN